MEIEVMVKQKKTFDAKYITFMIPYDDEDDLPEQLTKQDACFWNGTIDVDVGLIVDWPLGISADIEIKVCDSGIYKLIGRDMGPIATIKHNYVPNGILPGDSGDYIHFIINESGYITNWSKDISIDEFFPEDDD